VILVRDAFKLRPAPLDLADNLAHVWPPPSMLLPPSHGLLGPLATPVYPADGRADPCQRDHLDSVADGVYSLEEVLWII
jgi:hypothetical protein